MAFNPLAAKRFFELVRRVLGEDLVFESSSPELSITKIIDQDPPEDWIWKGVLPWSMRGTIAAAVGNRGKMAITNPAGSGRIVVVQGGKIVTKPGAGDLFVTGDGAAPGGGVSPANGIDSRIPLDVTGVLGIIPPTSTVGNAAGGVSGYFIDQAHSAGAGDVSSTVLPARPAIVTPGHNILLTDDTINEAAIFLAWGYTREARPEELQGK